LGQLTKLGLIGFGEPPQEPAEPGESQETGDDSITKLVLYVTQDCNLECRYCLTRRQGNIRRKHMSETAARAAVDLLFNESKHSKDLSIGFYGGEPLLRFDLIKSITRYADQKAGEFDKNVNYNVTTNGTLLTDEVIDFLARHNVHTLLSIDGRREIHDENRVYPDGSGSFDRISRGLAKLKEKTDRFSILSVVNNFETSQEEIAQFFLDMGCRTFGIALALSPDGEPDAGGGVDKFNRQFEEMVQYFLDRGLLSREKPPVDFSKVFRRLENKTRKETDCKGAYGRLSVEPDGNILPCENFIGNPTFYMGNVLTGIKKDHQKTFKKMRAANNRTCRACWARHLCGGWCPYFSFNKYGSLEKPVDTFCKMNKDYFEIALAVYSLFKKEARHGD
jgi:uncharacterized protein